MVSVVLGFSLLPKTEFNSIEASISKAMPGSIVSEKDLIFINVEVSKYNIPE